MDFDFQAAVDLSAITGEFRADGRNANMGIVLISERLKKHGYISACDTPAVEPVLRIADHIHTDSRFQVLHSAVFHIESLKLFDIVVIPFLIGNIYTVRSVFHPYANHG